LLPLEFCPRPGLDVAVGDNAAEVFDNPIAGGQAIGVEAAPGWQVILAGEVERQVQAFG
jgi:hypothetical protein